jgi:hypothetical protein
MTHPSDSRRWAQLAGIATIAAVVGGLLGFALGQRRGMAWGERLVGAEAGVGTMTLIEAATQLRERQPGAALRVLDWRIQTALDTFDAAPASRRVPSITQAVDFGERYRARYSLEVVPGSRNPGFSGLRLLKGIDASARSRPE